MAKKAFDPNIIGSVKSAASDSFTDNIKMIDIDKLMPHDENFYTMSETELLAEDILRQGLKENLVVREGEDGFYIVISGHRRREAIKYLIEQGQRKSKLIPCYINPVKSSDDELLDIIMLNATTRVISDADMITQYEKLKSIFEAKKADGDNIRIRDKIAEILGVSNGQVAKIENVIKNAAPEVKEAVKKGEMNIATANEAAKLPKETQKEITSKKPVSKLKSSDFTDEINLKKKPLSQMTTKKTEQKQTASVVINDNEFTELQKACMGYAVEVCRELRCNKEYIENFIEVMIDKFDEHTVEMAALIFQNRV